MTRVNEIAIRALMEADGIAPEVIDLAVGIAQGGEWLSTPEVCRAVKVSRWHVWRFCRDHGVKVQVRKGRCGSLVNARDFFAKWEGARP